MSPKETGERLIASNKKARHEYHILDTYEAGLVLTGSEVKSCRAGKVSLGEGYVRIEDEEAWLIKVNIAEYSHGGYANHIPLRRRKLLLHRREIDRMRARIEQKGYTVVPLRIYFSDRGIVKVELGIGRGKKLHDKRQTLRKREMDRDARRAMRRG